MSFSKSTPTDSGHGSNLPSVSTSAPPSSTVSSAEASSNCKYCKFLRWKSGLQFEGDWLFSSGNACSAHPVVPEGLVDLEREFDHADQAFQAFDAVSVPDGRKMLYQHAKDEMKEVISRRSTVHDKAKQLLGSTSFTLAIISASLALLHEWYAIVPWWNALIMLLLFAWVVSHFLRSLILSIQLITRDEVISVPTQQFVKILSAPKDAYKNGRIYVHLAAQTRAAAAATSRRVRGRVNQIILAQTSFRWGLTLLPMLVAWNALAIVWYSHPPMTNVPSSASTPLQQPSTNPANDTFESTLAKIGRTWDQRAAALARDQQAAADHVAKLETAVTGITSLQKDIDTISKRIDSLTTTTNNALPGLRGDISKVNQKLADLAAEIPPLKAAIDNRNNTPHKSNSAPADASQTKK
jgi:hypothetical protein